MPSIFTRISNGDYPVINASYKLVGSAKEATVSALYSFKGAYHVSRGVISRTNKYAKQARRNLYTRPKRFYHAVKADGLYNGVIGDVTNIDDYETDEEFKDWLILPKESSHIIQREELSQDLDDQAKELEEINEHIDKRSDFSAAYVDFRISGTHLKYSINNLRDAAGDLTFAFEQSKEPKIEQERSIEMVSLAKPVKPV